MQPHEAQKKDSVNSTLSLSSQLTVRHSSHKRCNPYFKQKSHSPGFMSQMRQLKACTASLKDVQGMEAGTPLRNTLSFAAGLQPCLLQRSLQVLYCTH